MRALGPLALLWWLASPAAHAEEAPPAADVGRIDAGRRIYATACSPCHGERGDGNGAAARMLDPRPRDFTSGVYKFRSTESGMLPLVDDVVRTVREGVPGTDMPSWRAHLADEEIRLVAEYVLTLSPRYRGEPVPDRIVAAAPEVLPPTRERLQRGEAIYRQMSCAKCHGAAGRGDGPAARTLKDDAGRPIPPLDFTRGFYKGGGRPVDVYRTFVTGLGGTPMPSYADALPKEADRWALVWYVLSLSAPDDVWSYLFGRFTPWK